MNVYGFVNAFSELRMLIEWAHEHRRYFKVEAVPGGWQVTVETVPTLVGNTFDSVMEQVKKWWAAGVG